jgi:hypothetical protein
VMRNFLSVFISKSSYPELTRFQGRFELVDLLRWSLSTLFYLPFFCCVWRRTIFFLTGLNQLRFVIEQIHLFPSSSG